MRMPLEGAEFLAALRVPQPRRLVPAPGQHLLAVRRERHGVNLPGMPRKARSSLPLWASHNRAVLSKLPVSTCLPSGANATEITAWDAQ